MMLFYLSIHDVMLFINFQEIRFLPFTHGIILPLELVKMRRKQTQFTHTHPHQCQSCTNAGGVFSRVNKVSQMFDCFHDGLMLAMLVFF